MKTTLPLTLTRGTASARASSQVLHALAVIGLALACLVFGHMLGWNSLKFGLITLPSAPLLVQHVMLLAIGLMELAVVATVLAFLAMLRRSGRQR